AVLHQNLNDLSSIELAFDNTAFVGGNAAAVGNAIGPVSIDYGIDFDDNPVSLAYSGSGFMESELNDGAVTGSITISLTGDTFEDPNTNNELEVGTEVSFVNLPAGLTPVVTLTSSTVAE